jgi:hypothetical protein
MALKAMAKGIKLLAIAAGTVLVGAFALAAKSIKKFAETDSTTKVAVDALKKSVDELQVALGSALVGGAAKAERSLGTMQVKIERLTAWIEVNSDAIHKMAIITVSAVKTALDWTVRFVNGLRLAFAFTEDWFRIATGVLSGIVETMSLGLLATYYLAEKGIRKLAKLAVEAADFMNMEVSAGLREFANKATSTAALDAQEREINATLDNLKLGFIATQGVLADQHAWDETLKSLAALGDGAVNATILMNRLLAAAEEAKNKKPRGAKKAKAEDPFAGQQLPGTIGHVVESWMTKAEEGKDANPLRDRIVALTELAAGLEKVQSVGMLAFQAMADGLGNMRTAMDDVIDGVEKMGIAFVSDFAGGAAQAFGAALTNMSSLGAAMADFVRQSLADAANQFGQFFILKGVAISLDPLLGGPAVGGPLIAAGLGLKVFGGALGAMGGGGGASAGGGNPAIPAAAAAAAFMPRQQEKEETRETTLVINIAGETVGPAIWRAMDEGVRLGHVAQFA